MATLNNLSDEELLRLAHIDLDPLTSSELERELVRRFENLITELAYHEPIREQLDGFDLTKTKDIEACKAVFEFADHYALDQAKPLLDVLTEFDIDDPAILKKALDRNEKIENLMGDLAEPLASLQALITTE